MTLLSELSQELEALVAKTAPAVVNVEHRRGQGSGLVLAQDGYILTNQHVVAGFDSVTIRQAQHASFSATVIATDSIRDIALLEFNPLFAPLPLRAEPLTFGTLTTNDAGRPVMALGYSGFAVKSDGTVGPVAANIGVVFQQPTLDLDLTVRQNLLYHAALHGLGRTESLARIETELGRLGMAERARERVRRLNGGHRRRVEIARALLHRPGLLLLDEPTVGLDVPTRQAIVAHVHSLAREDGVAVLWATHL
ncbi:MAG: ATP-binding cassette domain-containing protein, partial [SAR324 cluster bacterium]|nr:ATP-binding cassette domain-containing protein [SAR324 cluster bacterium]